MARCQRQMSQSEISSYLKKLMIFGAANNLSVVRPSSPAIREAVERNMIRVFVQPVVHQMKGVCVFQKISVLFQVVDAIHCGDDGVKSRRAFLGEMGRIISSVDVDCTRRMIMVQVANLPLSTGDLCQMFHKVTARHDQDQFYVIQLISQKKNGGFCSYTTEVLDSGI